MAIHFPLLWRFAKDNTACMQVCRRENANCKRGVYKSALECLVQIALRWWQI